VHRLISHQGAIADYGVTNGPRDDSALAAAFQDPLFTASIPFLVAPGTFYNYSNTNFMVAGLVAETAAGLPYREVMQQRVFRPLGMQRAAFLPEEVAADGDFAFGVQGGAVLAPGDYDNAVARPAGFAWTSIEDMAQYMKFLLHGDPAVLSPSKWQAMQSRQVSTFEELDLLGYGYGLTVQDFAVLPDSANQRRFYDRVQIVAHGGSIDGFQALVLTLPRQGFGYAALINGDASNPSSVGVGSCFAIAAVEAVGDRLPPPAAFPDPDIQRNRFADYVGTYADRLGLGGAVVSLTANGELSIQIPALDAAQIPYNRILQPVSRDNFVLQIGDDGLLLTGFREEGSPVVHLRTRPVVFTRVSEAQAAEPFSVQRLDPRQLENLLRAASRDATPHLPKLFPVR
jgi:CubicO group peptidase (beta-lactamase class C family)